jgi:hypothetical protein
MGRRQDSLKLAGIGEARGSTPICWLSAISGEHVSEVGERDTRNISITERGEEGQSERQQSGDHGEVMEQSPTSGEDNRPSEERSRPF